MFAAEGPSMMADRFLPREIPLPNIEKREKRDGKEEAGEAKGELNKSEFLRDTRRGENEKQDSSKRMKISLEGCNLAPRCCS
ncbi:hypothetical protein Tco_0132449 [Tanacetum coccineum]